MDEKISRKAKYQNIKKPRDERFEIPFDLDSLNLFCSYILSENTSIRKGHLINIRNLFLSINPEASFKNDIDKKETYKVTTSGLNEIRAVKYNVVGKRFLDRTNNNDMAIMPILSDDVVTYSGSKLVYKDTNYTCNFSIDEKNPITDLVWSEEDIQSLDFGVVTILQD